MLKLDNYVEENVLLVINHRTNFVQNNLMKMCEIVGGGSHGFCVTSKLLVSSRTMVRVCVCVLVNGVNRARQPLEFVENRAPT